MVRKEHSLGDILEKLEFFFGFDNKIFVDIFSEAPKSLFTNKFRNCSIVDQLSQK